MSLLGKQEPHKIRGAMTGEAPGGAGGGPVAERSLLRWMAASGCMLLLLEVGAPVKEEEERGKGERRE